MTTTENNIDIGTPGKTKRKLINIGLAPHDGLITIGISPHGFISIGAIPHGVISIGLVPMGVISVGLVSMGLLSVGSVSMGLMSLGKTNMSIMQLHQGEKEQNMSPTEQPNSEMEMHHHH
ncbi:MAG: hypothetical protein Tsb0014_29410 [Pleurocapsa sp.]